MKLHKSREVHQRAIKKKDVVLTQSCERWAEFHWMETVERAEEIVNGKAQEHEMPGRPTTGSAPLEASR